MSRVSARNISGIKKKPYMEDIFVTSTNVSGAVVKIAIHSSNFLLIYQLNDLQLIMNDRQSWSWNLIHFESIFSREMAKMAL